MPVTNIPSVLLCRPVCSLRNEVNECVTYSGFSIKHKLKCYRKTPVTLHTDINLKMQQYHHNTQTGGGNGLVCLFFYVNKKQRPYVCWHEPCRTSPGRWCDQSCNSLEVLSQLSFLFIWCPYPAGSCGEEKRAAAKATSIHILPGFPTVLLIYVQTSQRCWHNRNTALLPLNLNELNSGG